RNSERQRPVPPLSVRKANRPSSTPARSVSLRDFRVAWESVILVRILRGRVRLRCAFARDGAMSEIRKLLVANRGEIAIRVFRSAHELGIRTVAIYSHEDRFAVHRLKADEAYEVGRPGEPIRSYLDIESIIALAREKGVDAIHPGYGFLAENAAFARACDAAGIAFVGPRAELLDLLGDKVAARRIAHEAGVPILGGSPEPVLPGPDAQAVAGSLGYPVIVKASLGG